MGVELQALGNTLTATNIVAGQALNAATTSGARGGFGVPNAITKRALAGARGPVGTGSCTR